MSKREASDVIFSASVALDFHYAANLFRVIGDVLHEVNGDERINHALERAVCITAAGEALMRKAVEECDRRDMSARNAI